MDALLGHLVCIFYHLDFNFEDSLILEIRTINIGKTSATLYFKFNKLRHFISAFLFVFISVKSYSQDIPCPDTNCQKTVEILNTDITPEIITPFVTNPIDNEDDIENSFTQVTNQLKAGSDFYSFISDAPSPEETRRVEMTERMAKSRGFVVHRIVVPVNRYHLNAPKK